MSFIICNLELKELSANGRESRPIFEMDIRREQMHLGMSFNFGKTHPNANSISELLMVKLRYFVKLRPFFSLPKRGLKEWATVRDGQESYLSRGHGVNCRHVEVTNEFSTFFFVEKKSGDPIRKPLKSGFFYKGGKEWRKNQNYMISRGCVDTCSICFSK